MSQPGVVGITGATGFLGRALSSAFLRDGAQVVAFVREPHRIPSGPALSARAYDLGGPIPDLDGVSTIIHCAVMPRVSTHDDCVAANVDGTLALARRAEDCGTRFVFVSSINAASAADSAYARQKRAIEQGLPKTAIIVRPGLIAGNGGLFQTLARIARLPVVPLIDGGRQMVQIVAVEDVYAAIRLALSAGLTGVHTVVSEPPVKLRAIVQELGRSVPGPHITLDFPGWLVYTVASLAERLSIPLPVNAENIRGLQKGVRQSASPALLDRGWQPRESSAVLAGLAGAAQR